MKSFTILKNETVISFYFHVTCKLLQHHETHQARNRNKYVSTGKARQDYNLSINIALRINQILKNASASQKFSLLKKNQ